MPWLLAAVPALVSAGTAIYSATQASKNAKKAAEAQKTIASDIKFEPIDIEKLRREATEQAISNATQSLALERSLQPELAAVRAELPRQIAADLAAPNNVLPTDTVNEVTRAGRVIGSRSGSPESALPVTAQLLGLNSVDFMNQRHQQALRNAQGLLMQNDLAPTGLDPGAIASIEVANNAANNQFNLEKAGVNSTLANNEAAARAAQIGGQVGVASSLGNLGVQIGKGLSSYLNKKDVDAFL